MQMSAIHKCMISSVYNNANFQDGVVTTNFQCDFLHDAYDGHPRVLTRVVQTQYAPPTLLNPNLHNDIVNAVISYARSGTDSDLNATGFNNSANFGTADVWCPTWIRALL